MTNEVKFKMPAIIDYKTEQQQRPEFDLNAHEIRVVCVKYGTKYGADYVNNLYYGTSKNLTLKHSFYCFTEDGSGLDPNIKVITLKNHW